MEKEVMSKLTEGIVNDVDNYESIDINDDEQKSRVLGILTREIKIVTDKEKMDSDLYLAQKRLELDTAKLNADNVRITNEIDINRKKLELEEKKFKQEEEKFKQEEEFNQKRYELEYRKLKLEEDRLAAETQDKIAQSKKERTDKVINTIIRVLEIGAPLAVNAALVLMNLRLVYIDDGRIPSEMKDLMKNVYRG